MTPIAAPRAAARLCIAATLAMCAGCTPTPEPSPPAAPTPEQSPVQRQPTIDAHVHLTGLDAATDLIAEMDRRQIERAVVLGTPDALAGRGRGGGMAGHDRGNREVLAAARAHPRRLVPFAAVDLEQDSVETLDAWRTTGGCGFKVQQGDHRLRVRPLDDPKYSPLWTRMAELGAPVLIHVNTTRFRAEFERLLDAHPTLNAVCAHWCSSRTDLDRLEQIAAAHPRLRFDTSGGAAGPSARGNAALSANRDKAKALIARWPNRFLFGSDLVTHRVGDWRQDWADQIEIDRGFLAAEQVETWVPTPGQRALTRGTLPTLALDGPLLDRVLRRNAADWLASCDRPDAATR